MHLTVRSVWVQVVFSVQNRSSWFRFKIFCRFSTSTTAMHRHTFATGLGANGFFGGKTTICQLHTGLRTFVTQQMENALRYIFLNLKSRKCAKYNLRLQNEDSAKLLPSPLTSEFNTEMSKNPVHTYPRLELTDKWFSWFRQQVIPQSWVWYPKLKRGQQKFL